MTVWNNVHNNVLIKVVFIVSTLLAGTIYSILSWHNLLNRMYIHIVLYVLCLCFAGITRANIYAMEIVFVRSSLQNMFWSVVMPNATSSPIIRNTSTSYS